MKYLFARTVPHLGEELILKADVNRWKRQMNTEYKDLSDKEKESDRNQADKFIEKISRFKNEETQKTFKEITIEEFFSKEKGIVYWNYRFNGIDWVKQKTGHTELPWVEIKNE